MAKPVEPEALEGALRFGPYTLVRRIGAGGMGEVFLAREESQRRACVVKKVLPRLMASPQFVGRFRDEARVMVRLDHPNIARVYAMGEVDGQLYLAMEYVQGKTLSRLAYRLRQLGRTIPLGILLHLGERLCQGLAYAHDAKDEDGHPLHLVHRDLSPANVCLSYAGDVKIIDFGAAQSTLKEEHTAPRVVIGNLTYMAPEQARKRFVDRRADVYAAGALLWELVAWKPLAQRGDPVERWRRAAYPTWEPAGRLRKGVPPALDAFLMRALSPEPEHRFPDAAAMGAELARLKAKLTPQVGDADVARLMAAAFPREKVAEEKALQELLRGDTSRRRTEREVAAVLTPPNALAFEHSGIDTPDDLVSVPGSDAEAPRGAGEGAVPLGAPERRGGAMRTAMYGSLKREPDAVATEALTASKVRDALDRAEAQDASRAREAGDGAATEALKASAEALSASKPRAVSTSDATEALSAEKVRSAINSAASEVSKGRAVIDGSATEALSASKVRSAINAASEGSKGRAAIDLSATTEALSASKVLGAISRAEAERASGLRQTPVPEDSEDNEDTVTVTPMRASRQTPLPEDVETTMSVSVTPVMAPRGSGPRPAPRRAPRELQVGFGVDISQPMDSAALEARRLELVRAITGEDEAAVVAAPHAWLQGLQGRRALVVAGLFACACALGLGVAWALQAAP